MNCTFGQMRSQAHIGCKRHADDNVIWIGVNGLSAHASLSMQDSHQMIWVSQSCLMIAAQKELNPSFPCDVNQLS